MQKRNSWKEKIARWIRQAGIQRPFRIGREHLSTILQFFKPPPPLHRSEEVAPFFIVGPGRCGSTLLRRVLQSNSAVHIPPEIFQFKKTVLRFQRYRRLLDWEDLSQLILWPLVWHSEFDDEFFKHLPVLQKKIQQLPVSERSLARLIDMLYRYHGKRIGAEFERWGDKTPLNVNWMGEIVAVFPNARFVFMLRDGTDVVHSHMDALGNSLRGAARTWKKSLELWQDFRQHYPGQCRVMRYEEFVRDPESEIRRLCDFLELDFSSSMVKADRGDKLSDLQRIDHHRRALKPITEDRVGVGHRSLSSAEKKNLKKIIGEEMKNWGYSV
jgi:protein-tyrosine sulfotransferase